MSLAPLCAACGAGFGCRDCGGLCPCYCGEGRSWTDAARRWLARYGWCPAAGYGHERRPATA